MVRDWHKSSCHSKTFICETALDWQKIVPIGLFVVSVAAAVMLYSYVYSRRSKERKKYSEGNLLI